MNHYLILILFIINCSCKNTEAPEKTLEIVEIPEEFVRFYDRFHSDSIYQLEHIIFPLSQKSDSTNWIREDWKMHKPFDSQNGNFSRDLDNFEGIITETIREKNGAFIIKRRFSVMGDQYHLIYYSLQNRLEGWGEQGG